MTPPSEQSQQLDIQQALTNAVEHFNADRLAEAEGIFRQVLRIQHDHPDALHLLGLVTYKSGDFNAAVGLIYQALALKPDLAEAHNNLAQMFHEQGQFAEAISSYKTVLALKPDSVETHYCLGNAFKDFEQLELAVESHMKAIALNPDFAWAHNNLGNLFQELGRLEESIASHQQALILDPGLEGGWYNLHISLFDTADLNPAADCLEKALKIDPGFTRARLDLGLIRDYQGNAEAATGHFDRAVKEADWVSACIESWHYITSIAGPRPNLFGNTSVGLCLGMDAATIDGLTLEFGVRFGTSIRQIASLTKDDVHGFDSFQGLPESWDGQAEGLYTVHGQLPAVPENVHLHVGFFEDTLPLFVKEHSGPVRFANIDCDIYSSTRTILESFAERIVPGTVLVFDEFLGNPNWREDEFKAFQEAASEFGWQYEYLAFSLISYQAVVLIR